MTTTTPSRREFRRSIAIIVASVFVHAGRDRNWRKRENSDRFVAYEPIAYPPNSFEGCQTIADRILSALKLRIDADRTETEATEEASRNATDRPDNRPLPDAA
jgi:hypothetical protein